MAALGDRSATDVRNELLALLEAKQPALGSWSDGAQTSVSANLGLPTDVGDSGTFITYRVPLSITTEDGRVDIARTANAAASAGPDGALTNPWLEISTVEPVTAPEFAKQSGISGVNFRALWHTELYPMNPSEGTPRGRIVVEGITSEGAYADTLLEELTWSLE